MRKKHIIPRIPGSEFLTVFSMFCLITLRHRIRIFGSVTTFPHYFGNCRNVICDFQYISEYFRNNFRNFEIISENSQKMRCTNYFCWRKNTYAPHFLKQIVNDFKLSEISLEIFENSLGISNKCSKISKIISEMSILFQKFLKKIGNTILVL